ncbi:hypothetical protein DUI87_04872 [Hirundo rustica rustica]|uniref:Uncharacterized protein n=1 Tax=Hirundo rustica rustica TaxID=333673 RepID=A0A3M0KYY1_HIRRU|nr:hypothetical protein DUI87_04872 [Hirundo rustica rustica]
MLRQEKGLVLKCLREHLNPEPSMKEERMGVDVEKSWKMDSLTMPIGEILPRHQHLETQQVARYLDISGLSVAPESCGFGKEKRKEKRREEKRREDEEKRREEKEKRREEEREREEKREKRREEKRREREGREEKREEKPVISRLKNERFE